MSISRSAPLRVVAVLTLLAASLLAGCADMPLNKPSALSPAHHGAAEVP